jgi:prevent-host-death family protein
MIATVRIAKARFSELLERAAAGEEIVITSDGRPKAKIVGLGHAPRPFRVNHGLLRRGGGGRSADVLVREDRNARN